MKRKKIIVGCLLLTIFAITIVGFNLAVNDHNLGLDLKLPIGQGDGGNLLVVTDPKIPDAPNNSGNGGLYRPSPPGLN